jgi:hypothetical protein
VILGWSQDVATDIPLYGHQPERFLHGYYDSYCYLPLYIFAGDQLLRARLRPANQDAAKGSVEEVGRIVEQLRQQRIDNWSLTSLQQRLVKTGGRLIKHARYYWLLLAESQLTRRLFGSMVWRIASLPLPAG